MAFFRACADSKKVKKIEIAIKWKYWSNCLDPRTMQIIADSHGDVMWYRQVVNQNIATLKNDFRKSNIFPFSKKTKINFDK